MVLISALISALIIGVNRCQWERVVVDYFEGCTKNMEGETTLSGNESNVVLVGASARVVKSIFLISWRLEK